MKDNHKDPTKEFSGSSSSSLSLPSSIPHPSNVPPSRKNRKKPKLNSKRHVLSLTTPTGIGVKVASQPNRLLGQGKRTIWVGMEEKEETVSSSKSHKKQKKGNTSSMGKDKNDTNKQIQVETTDTMLNESKSITTTTTTAIYSASPKCLVESQFATYLWKLRKQFVIQCRPIVPPILTLERWYQTIYMTMDDNDAKVMDIANEGLQQDLQRVGMELSQIHSIMEWLKEKQQRQQQHSMKLSKDTTTTTTTQQVSTKSKKRKKENLMSTSSSITNPTFLHVIRHKHTLDLVLYPQRAQLWKLNYEHYDKLEALWKRTWTKEKKENSSCNDDNEDANDKDDNDNTSFDVSTQFHQDLFCLLCRYNSLQGPGFQAACPEQVFMVLQRQFQTFHECFASPLNCYFDSFCSAFLHVDEPFGSSGSFWDFQPKTGGSFHVNPPFVHAIMVRMVTKLESLLSQEVLPFSFIIIVPVWLEDSSYHALVSSPYKIHHFILAKADHGFCDGSQHQRRDRYRTSPYDTAVILWQNKLGTKQYSPNDGNDWEFEIRKAFATGVPTIAAKQRRIRDGRGLADEDGGGGNYCGRRQNQTGNGVEQRKRKERRTLKKQQKV